MRVRLSTVVLDSMAPPGLLMVDPTLTQRAVDRYTVPPLEIWSAEAVLATARSRARTAATTVDLRSARMLNPPRGGDGPEPAVRLP
ncbi:hypothetical protein [Nonomuraea sp. NPDC052265]|uniref:hypothetical protein n=1 Tax=Nonomuraea sp. NPDC052265 TaxID=3364374 RepID=UPI0037C88786